MAAVLEHRSLAQPSPTFPSSLNKTHSDGGSLMAEPYLCYRTFSGEDAQHITGDANLRICGLDGIDDRSLDNPFKRSKRSSRTMSMLNPNNDTQLPSRSPAFSDTNDVFDHTSTSHDDQNAGRRKRRKITLAQDNTAAQGNSTVEAGDLEGLGGTTPVKEAEKGGEEARSQNAIEETIGDESGNNKCGIAALQTSSNITTSNVSTFSESVKSTSTNNGSKRRTTVKAKPSTPRKKTMTLHTNGKLLSSPALDVKSLVVSKAVDTVKEKDATSATKRHFKMKRGKFIQSLEVVLRYGQDENSRRIMGAKVSRILSVSHDVSLQTKLSETQSKTHPFFLGRMKQLTHGNPLASTHGDSSENDTDSTTKRPEPVAWKDIKFTAQRPTFVSRGVESPRSIWPPLTIQHVGRDSVRLCLGDSPIRSLENAKLKSTTTAQDNEDDNILTIFSQKLKGEFCVAETIELPERLRLGGHQVQQALAQSCTNGRYDIISAITATLLSGSSAFDQGRCAGPNLWSIQYAPTRSSEVLQSSTSVLYKWLQGMTTHNIKSGVDTHGSARRTKNVFKKKKRRLKGELDDFVVDSDDDNRNESSNKNAILLVGPYGCGKTASVYATARELGFEVFEIHPGMKRSAKDIFDKVGDMAHNHLVHKGAGHSRESSIVASDIEAGVNGETDITQPTAACFLGEKSTAAPKGVQNTAPSQTKREQKQSLILFEEVDLLFEDDKGFWSGVQNLIQNSKRPVVMTCNDLGAVPTEDLDLYDILTYTAIESGPAVDLLMHVAAAEGHIIDREALSTLYRSKRNDLRASITELNLWCQMTVGSKQGGLDWMVRDSPDNTQLSAQGQHLRTFSKGTYHKALDLMPEISLDNETAMQYAHESLGIAATEWCDIAHSSIFTSLNSSQSRIETLSLLSSISEARSVADVLDDSAMPTIACATMGICGINTAIPWRNTCDAVLVQQLTSNDLRKQELSAALAPLLTEKPTFPPSQGRLAPSIDLVTTSTALDIAPYVRCIVGIDSRLEQQRNEVFGSQGKARKTRASRAAAEGSDKASTRSGRWFPPDLDFQKVVNTAGPWSSGSSDDQGQIEELSMASPSVSSPTN